MRKKMSYKTMNEKDDELEKKERMDCYERTLEVTSCRPGIYRLD